MRLRAALAAGADRLRRGGIAGAERDARALLAHAACVTPDRIALMPDAPLAAEAAARFEALLARRLDHVPVSRLLGFRDFWKHRFRVSEAVLDPRPETEVLVSKALEAPFSKVLDLGTGTGCILISLLADMPGAEGVGTDISAEAVLVAGENAARIGVAERLILPLSDWFADIGGRYDLIVSNPPYIATAETAGLAPEVRDHDPGEALTDGGDGLAAYRAIAAGAPRHLTPGGRLLVEIGASQAAAVTAIFHAAGLEDIAVSPDLDGRDRVIRVRGPV